MGTATEALGQAAPAHRAGAGARARQRRSGAAGQRFTVPGYGSDGAASGGATSAAAAAAGASAWSPSRPFAGMAQGSLLGLQEYRSSAGSVGSLRVGGAGAYAAVGGAAAARGADQGGTAAAAAAGACGFTSAGYGRFIGRSTGSGQCVALVQAANPDLGSTRSWAAGASVQQGGGGNGGADLQPGTVIATFDRSGRYANASDGSSHAAIYLGQNEQGIQVLDQWAGRPAAPRTIPWSNPGGAAANVAGNYRVVVHSA